jgi:hypothetical protein
VSAQTPRRTSIVIASLGAVAIAIASAGAAVAISSGFYGSHKQGCGKHAASHTKADTKQPKGCHDLQVLVRDGKGHKYFEVGTEINKNGDIVHSGNVMVSPDGSGTPKGDVRGTGVAGHIDTNWQPIPPDQCGTFDIPTYPIGLLLGGGCKLDPTAWNLPAKPPSVTKKVKVGKNVVVAPSASHLQVYFGADDGLDSGEHDEPSGKHGTRHAESGPSDGGSIRLKWHPAAAPTWASLVLAGAAKGKVSKIATDPFPLLDAGAGGCADGICVAGTSKREDVYHGGGKGGKRRSAYDYQGKQWDPYDCNGASDESEKKCHDKTHKTADDYYRDDAHHVSAQPGVQVYEDPDPSGSPIAPDYPIPAVYAGSCGVTVGGGSVKAPKSPVTNHSGQVAIKTAHC